MVFIGAAQQNRVFEVARQQLGSSGESLVRTSALHAFNLPLDQITYFQLGTLLQTIERDAPPHLGLPPAADLAAALRRLCDEIASSLSSRLVAAVARRMGPAAEPFLENVCATQGLLLATLDRGDMPVVAQAVRRQAALLLGDDAAESIASAALEAVSVGARELGPKVLALIVEHTGAEGTDIVRGICRARLEVEIEELESEGVLHLARLVEDEAPARIAAVRAAAFATAARRTMTSPADGLRRTIVDLAKDAVGPAGLDLVRAACARAEMPFEAIEHEHLMWLAEALRAETTPIVGKKAADALARDVRALLTGRK